MRYLKIASLLILNLTVFNIQPKIKEAPHTPTTTVIRVGGPGSCTPAWCMEDEGYAGFRQYFADGSKVLFCTINDEGKTRYLTILKNDSSGLYYLGLQDNPSPLTIRHNGSDAITLELPSPSDKWEEEWAAGPWLVWGDPLPVPSGTDAYSHYCKTLHQHDSQRDGFLNERSDGKLVLPDDFDSRQNAIKFWLKKASDTTAE
jgi:hypothetical protein